MESSLPAPDGGLFQSEVWKEFQVSLGREIFEGELFWGVIEHAPLLGRYGEVSRGPLQERLKPHLLNKTFTALAQKNNLSLIRVEPQHDALLRNLLRSGLRVKKAPLDAQPKEFLMLNLEKSENELLAAMKSKTRYNIRLAEKKGIEVRPFKSNEEKAELLDLFSATAKRKNISFHSRKYYEASIDFFSDERGATFVAVQDGKVLAGSILAFFADTAYYLHGGSSDEGRNAMAPHLLQWEQIRASKAKKCTQYDFGGVSIQHVDSRKDWRGITRFKTGFAPHTKSLVLPGTYDIIFSPFRYYTYKWLTGIKNIFV